MPLLGLFSKRDKHRQPSTESTGVTSVSSRSESENAESEYVLPTSNLPVSRNGHDVYNGPVTASSSKLKLPGFRRKGQHGSPALASAKNIDDATRDSKSSTFSSAASEADLDLLKVPLPDKKSLFASSAYGDPHGARSTRSLPHEPGHLRQGSQDSIRTDMGKKHNKSSDPLGSTPHKKSALFAWATRERTKSKPTRPPSPPVESFNLKAFRHVGPSESPSISPRAVSPSPSIPFSPTPPPVRPRGNSIASESSQRISVAAFREAQARRSAAPSPVPSLRPPSNLDLPRVPAAPSQSPRSSTVQPAGPRTPARQPPRKVSAPAIPTNSSSDEESEEEEESDSDAEATLRPDRQRTITQKSRSELGHRSRAISSNNMQKPSFGSKSELGHGQSPRIRNTPSGSESIRGSPSPHSRARASASTSALAPSAAAQRASQLAAANAAGAATSSPSNTAISAHQRQPARNADTSESESSRSEDETDEDDAPLARFVPPKRPGTSASAVSNSSATSRTRKPSQPLIDISALGPSPALPHKEKEGANSTATSFSPTNLTERLAGLTKGLGGKSTDNLSAVERDSASASAAAMKQPKPRRNTTSSVDAAAYPELFSFSPILTNPDSAIVSPGPKPVTSSPESMSPSASPVEQKEVKRIVPTPVRQRESPPSFSVTSRPRSTHTISEPLITTEPPTPGPAPRANSSYAALGLGSHPPSMSTSSSRSYQPSTARPSTLVSLIPPGSGFGNNPMPRKPFAEHDNFGRGMRGNSPASSTGDSSSGRAPYTPKDGSDYGNDRSWDNKSASNTSSNADTARRKGHKKSSSVTFEDEVNKIKEQERERGRPTTVTRERAEMMDKEAEQKRKERRRSEAKAAIELGNIVNGRGSIDNDEDEDEDAPIGAANMGPRMNMLNAPNPMMGGGMPGMNFGPSLQPPMHWGAWPSGAPPTPMLTPQSTGMLSPQAFMIPPPPPSAGQTFLAAHERAMMIAKQTYQMAVAQQAMAAAADEWERSSTYAGSTYGGASSAYNGSMGMGGMNAGWSNGGVMFPAGPSSAYAASDAGSEIGGWGSRSVYGESFGPPRNSMMQGQGFYSPRTESMGQMAAPARGGLRPRTKSSPHDQPRPSSGKKAPPPSSWTARYHTALRDGP
ncbi:hypothetical protein NEOLEDRAFT_90957 [Neolentinus lepideus HHB14362 ss-1]|uniref:Uncharacterized protein n=1 Tax=Neolentinus lepideus HHB14362 ss-1 TaxID=1314782 RepID=A0A165U1Q8_9AGAM|nr:hypothetical protein NEOLEDRAFT_90957 [Neolentinus lepideus HHB14362 ss-1]